MRASLCQKTTKQSQNPRGTGVSPVIRLRHRPTILVQLEYSTWSGSVRREITMYGGLGATDGRGFMEDVGRGFMEDVGRGLMEDVGRGLMESAFHFE